MHIDNNYIVRIVFRTTLFRYIPYLILTLGIITEDVLYIKIQPHPYPSFRPFYL